LRIIYNNNLNRRKVKDREKGLKIREQLISGAGTVAGGGLGRVEVFPQLTSEAGRANH
jgi:hypothetical protein